DFPGVFPAARYLPNEEEAFLADALGKLTDDIAKAPQCLRAHVLGRVDAEPIDIGISDPETIDESQAGQGRGSLPILAVPLHPEVEGFQAEHVSFGVFRVVVPVHDVPLAEEQVRALELPRPDRAVGPRRIQGIRLRLPVEWQRRPAFAVVETLDGVRLAVPARVVVPPARGGIVRRVAVRGVAEDVAGVVGNDVENDVDPLFMRGLDTVAE